MKQIIYITLVNLLLFSCDMETVIDLEIPEQDPVLVLNGILETDKNVKVLVSHSVGAFSNNSLPSFISDAEVLLYKDNQLIGSLEPDLSEEIYVYYENQSDDYYVGLDSLPMYYYKREYMPEKQANYKLEVNHPAYENIEAETYLPKDVELYDIDIDTISNDENIGLTFSFDDLVNQQNYYRLKLFTSCTKDLEKSYDEEDRFRGYAEMMSNDPSFPGNIFDVFSGYSFIGQEVVFTDALFNGQQKTINIDVESEFKFGQCDTVIIEFSTFSDDTYRYYNSLGDHREKGELGIFGGEVIPVYTNVKNGLGVLVSTNAQKIILKP